MSFDPDFDGSFTQQTAAKNYVKFYSKWVRNNYRSKQEGVEIGENRDFVMIICPGQPKSAVHEEVKESHKREYPIEWSQYQQGREQQQSGTPIELLPGIPNGRADSLKAIYIYTIEQLAEASDMAVQKIGIGGVELRTKAQAYLKKNSAEVAGLQEQLTNLAEQNADLLKRLAELETKPKKRGPKPKDKECPSLQ